MHATIYREGNSAIMSGAGFPTSFSADGSEPSITSNGITYWPMQAAVDLSGLSEARLSAYVVSYSGPAPSATLPLEYSTDGGATWKTAGVSLTISGGGLTVGTWSSIPADCDDVLLRITTSDESGNGGATVTPLWITIDARA